MKNKDKHWYDAKIQDIKKRKRQLCKSISDGEYNSQYSNDDSAKNNKEVKKIKGELKREKRAAKRAERKNWKDEVDEIINKNIKND